MPVKRERSETAPGEKIGLTSKVVALFLTSHLSLLFIIGAFLAGALALVDIPREEEPQIVVPMADVFVSFPGASAVEIERLVATPLESLLWEVDGVEHVYSVSRPGEAMVSVRFFVGEDRERSIVKLYNKIMSHQDEIPPGVSGWIVKPVEIDDVPIVTLTLYGSGQDGFGLRRVAEELLDRLRRVPDTGKAFIAGGYRRQVRVLIDPQRLSAHQLDFLAVERSLRAANVNGLSGEMTSGNRTSLVETGPFFRSAGEVADAVIGTEGGRPVYLRDVADVRDGPEETRSYTRIGFGPASDQKDTSPSESQAVTLAIAKRKGSNAVRVADSVLREVDRLKGSVIPDGVEVYVSRNYGETANEKVNELVRHLFIAIVTIVILVAIALGWREALIIAVAVPMTLALTILGDWLLGYSINRVTLFALILSLGLLADDPIVDVENIHRRLSLKNLPPYRAVLAAVEEIRPPTVLATLTVIMSFLSMLKITGMTGPYMQPMPFNVTLAMLASLVIAFTVTPWAAYRLLRHEHAEPEIVDESGIKGGPPSLYRRVMTPLLLDRNKAYLVLAGVGVAFVASVLLAVLGLVPMKMLPFDNKNELQLVVDMPEGTPLEQTDAVSRELEGLLARVPEVEAWQTYVGEASPFDFNGFVRHYYLRRAPNESDIRINLAPKGRRAQQSHAIGLRIRPEVDRIARRFGANVKIVEVPPGPPVMSTLVAEVYAPPGGTFEEQRGAARAVRKGFEKEAGVVDVDDTLEADQTKVNVFVDREKAALHGLTVEAIEKVVRAALAGEEVGTLHKERERFPLPIVLRLPRAERSHPDDLKRLYLRGEKGEMVPLSELVRVSEGLDAQSRWHKDLKPVIFVTGETAGRSPVDAILSLQRHFSLNPLPPGYSIFWRGEGEWEITVNVFRDLGIAFGIALLGIYILLVAQTGSLGIPLVIMAAIPLTLIGIMPGFYLLNLFFSGRAGPYTTPIFFTATGMIGMIALAGIVVRNAIILIDFIRKRVAEGAGLFEAVIASGEVRLRPILLTAGAVLFGAWVITLDPIFSGLAWSFIFGLFASTLFTLIVVPLIYFLIYQDRGERNGLPGANGDSGVYSSPLKTKEVAS
jgi:multidrug efflux pump subunit AcrB